MWNESEVIFYFNFEREKESLTDSAVNILQNQFFLGQSPDRVDSLYIELSEAMSYTFRRTNFFNDHLHVSL